MAIDLNNKRVRKLLIGLFIIIGCTSIYKIETYLYYLIKYFIPIPYSTFIVSSFFIYH